MHLLLGAITVVSLTCLVTWIIWQAPERYRRWKQRQLNVRVTGLGDECDMFLKLLSQHRTITISQLRREMREWYPRLEAAEIDTIAEWAFAHNYCWRDIGRDDLYYSAPAAGQYWLPQSVRRTAFTPE